MVSRTLQDLFNISEIIKKGITIPQNEILVISEEKIKDIDKSLLEAITIAELYAKDAVYFVDLIEQVSLAETFTEKYDFLFSDAFFLADAISITEVESLQSRTILLSGKNAAIIRTKSGKTILLTK